MNQIYGHFTLKYCLFGAVKRAKNANPARYFILDMVLDSNHAQFLISNFDVGNNDNIFGADNSSSVHADINIYILVLGEGPTQGLDNAAVTIEAK